MSSYKDNGLTWKSNLVTKNSRDDSGNITLREGDTPENNPDVFIDPVISTFAVENFINLVNTRFSYFKFPTTSVSNATELDYDTELAFEAFDEASFITDVITQERELLVSNPQEETSKDPNKFAVSCIHPHDWPAKGWNVKSLEAVNYHQNLGWWPEWVQYEVLNKVPLSRLGADGERTGDGKLDFIITDTMRQQLRDLDESVNSKLKVMSLPEERYGPNTYYRKPQIRHAIKIKCILKFENATWYYAPDKSSYDKPADAKLTTAPVLGYNSYHRYGNNYYFAEFGLDGWYPDERGYRGKTRGGWNPGTKIHLMTSNNKYKLGPLKNQITATSATSYHSNLNSLVGYDQAVTAYPDTNELDFDILYEVLRISMMNFERSLIENFQEPDELPRYRDGNRATQYNSVIKEWKQPGDIAYIAVDQMNALGGPQYKDDNTQIKIRTGWNSQYTRDGDLIVQKHYRPWNVWIDGADIDEFSNGKEITYLPFTRDNLNKNTLKTKWVSSSRERMKLIYQIYIWLTLLGVKNTTKQQDKYQKVWSEGTGPTFNNPTNYILTIKTLFQYGWRDSNDNPPLSQFTGDVQLTYNSYAWSNSRFKDWFHQLGSPNTGIQVNKSLSDSILASLNNEIDKSRNSIKTNINNYNLIQQNKYVNIINTDIKKAFGDYNILSRFQPFDDQGDGASLAFEYVISPDLLDSIEIKGNGMDNPAYSLKVASVLPSVLTSAKMDAEIIQVPCIRSGSVETTNFDIIPLPENFNPKYVNIFGYQKDASTIEFSTGETRIVGVGEYYGSYSWGNRTIDPRYTGLINVSNNTLLLNDPWAQRTYIPAGSVVGGNFYPSAIEYKFETDYFTVDGIDVNSNTPKDNGACFRFHDDNRWPVVLGDIILKDNSKITFNNNPLNFDVHQIYNIKPKNIVTSKKERIEDVVKSVKSQKLQPTKP